MRLIFPREGYCRKTTSSKSFSIPVRTSARSGFCSVFPARPSLTRKDTGGVRANPGGHSPRRPRPKRRGESSTQHTQFIGAIRAGQFVPAASSRPPAPRSLLPVPCTLFPVPCKASQSRYACGVETPTSGSASTHSVGGISVQRRHLLAAPHPQHRPAHQKQRHIGSHFRRDPQPFRLRQRPQPQPAPALAPARSAPPPRSPIPPRSRPAPAAASQYE